MTDHKKLLKELNVEHDLNLMEIDIKFDVLRAEMVAKYGENKVSKLEEEVIDLYNKQISAMA